MIYLFLVVSVIVNIIGGWIVFRLLRNAFGYSENIYYLIDRLYDFSDHLKALEAMEAYHGDETLEAFVKHTAGMCEEIEGFKEKHILEIEELEYAREEEEEKDNAQAQW